MSDIELSTPEKKSTGNRTSLRNENRTSLRRSVENLIVDSLEGNDTIMSGKVLYHSGEKIDGKKVPCTKVFERELILRGEESYCLEVYLTECDQNNVPLRLLILAVDFVSNGRDCECSVMTESSDKFYLIHKSDVYVYQCKDQRKRDEWVEKINKVIELGKEKLRSLQGEKGEALNPIVAYIDKERQEDSIDVNLEDNTTKEASSYKEFAAQKMKYIQDEAKQLYQQHQPLQLQRLPRYRIVAAIAFFLISLIVFSCLADYNRKIQGKEVLIQHEVEDNQQGKCLCYTVLNGEYSIDANGYWSTSSNFEENQKVYLITFENYETSYENLNKLGGIIKNELNNVAQTITTLNMADQFIYLATYEFKQNNPLQDCNPSKFNEKGQFTITIDITPMELMKQLYYAGNTVNIQQITGGPIPASYYSDSSKYYTDFPDYLQSNDKSHCEGYDFFGNNGHMSDLEPQCTDSSYKYITPWGVSFADNKLNLEFDYIPSGYNNKAIYNPVDADGKLANYYPLDMILFDNFESNTDAGDNPMRSSQFYLDMNTVFSAMALNRGLISDNGYAYNMAIPTEDGMNFNKLKESLIYVNDAANIPLLTIDGVPIYTEAYLNNTIDSDNGEKFFQWYESSVPFKYDLYGDVMDPMFCIQAKLFVDENGDTSDAPSYKSTPQDISCGINQGIKVLIPSLTFVPELSPEQESYLYYLKLSLQSDLPIFGNTFAGGTFSLYFSLESPGTFNPANFRLKSGYFLGNYVWPNPFVMELPTYDESSSSSAEKFWSKSLIESGSTGILYFCYLSDSTVFVNSVSSSYSSVLLLEVILVPFLIFVLIWLTRLRYGEDVAKLYYQPVISNESMGKAAIDQNKNDVENDASV